MTPLEQYLREDRQWPKHLRIAHAKYRMKMAESKEDKSFWKQVILANTESSLSTERNDRDRSKPVKFKAPHAKQLP
jgi:hypothetical protein